MGKEPNAIISLSVDATGTEKRALNNRELEIRFFRKSFSSGRLIIALAYRIAIKASG